jgi:hypothetical protein
MASSIMARCWFGSSSISLDSRGYVGGLTISWNPSTIQLNNFSTTRHFLISHYHLLGTKEEGYITNLYSRQILQEKLQFLKNIGSTHTSFSIHHHIMGGYFNMITTLEEKRGGICHLDVDKFALKDFILASCLIDIDTLNGIHTWNNKQGG